MPRRPVVIVATIGAGMLTVLWTWTAVTVALGRGVTGQPLADDFPIGFTDCKGLLGFAAYIPLGVLTAAYAERRRAA